MSYRTILKSKIHRCTITDADLNYEGSIGIDANLMEAADIYPYERVDVWDVTNGERFYTYALTANPGEIIVNGAAARKVAKGDLLIIASWKHVDNRVFSGPEDPEDKFERPRLIFVDSSNRQINGNHD